MTSTTPPLSAYTIFLDRNVGRNQVAAILRSIGLTIEVHHVHFPEAEQGERDDVEWIEKVTSWGWVIFTRDKRIRHNPLERAAYIRAGARVFVMSRGDVPADKVALCVQLAQKRIERELAERAPPYVIGISLGGHLTFIDPPDSSVKRKVRRVKRRPPS